MTQLLESNLPVYFQCLAVPVEWKRALLPYKNLASLMDPNFPEPQEGDLLAVHLVHSRDPVAFDPWEKRNEFFRLPQGDTDALLAFLRRVGFFERPRAFIDEDGIETIIRVKDDETHYVQYNHKTSEKRIWGLRRLLMGSLEKLSTWTGKHSDFQMRIVRSKGEARVIVTTTTFLEAIQLTLTVDRVMGAKVTKCGRPDCTVPFSTTGGHKRKYCSWYCGHIESVRRSRRQNRSKKGVKRGK
jgi:hypothetical protein